MGRKSEIPESLSDWEVAKRLGCSVEDVQQTAKEIKPPIKKIGGYTPVGEIDKIREQREARLGANNQNNPSR